MATEGSDVFAALQRRITLIQERETAECDEMLTWWRENGRVRVVTAEVPAALLPEGCKLVLHDARVDPGRGWPRTDDAVYEAHRDVWRNVSRGNCIAELHATDGGHPRRAAMVAVRSLRKFTGGNGDDDDTAGEAADDAWSQFFLDADGLATCSHVVSMDKVNGEAAHVACRELPDLGIALVFVGSKNVHIALPCRLVRGADGSVATTVDLSSLTAAVEAYEGERFRVARRVGLAMQRILTRLGPSRASALLHELHSLRVTATFEMVMGDYQHVVAYPGVPACGEAMHFLCFTLNWYPPSDDGVDEAVCVEPEAGLHRAAELGLPTCDYLVHRAPLDLDAVGTEARRRTGTEGRVLYFVRGSRCVGLVKKKATWYVLLRATREKARAMVDMFFRPAPETAAAKKKEKKRQRQREHREQKQREARREGEGGGGQQEVEEDEEVGGDRRGDAAAEERKGSGAGQGAGAAAAVAADPTAAPATATTETPLTPRAKQVFDRYSRALGQRYKEIQSWLRIDDAERVEWERKGTAFLAWLAAQLGSGAMPDNERVRAQFVDAWAEFER